MAFLREMVGGVTVDDLVPQLKRVVLRLESTDGRYQEFDYPKPAGLEIEHAEESESPSGRGQADGLADAGMIQNFEFATDDGVVRIERAYQEISLSSNVADKAWRFTDASGHEHSYRRRHQPGDDEYPTLAYVAGPSYYCAECGDEHEDYAVSHYECRICGEAVEPGSVPPQNPAGYVLTRQTAYLDGRIIGQQEAEAILSRKATASAGDGNEHVVSLAAQGGMRPA